jgi:hypothetical protein
LRQGGEVSPAQGQIVFGWGGFHKGYCLQDRAINYPKFLDLFLIRNPGNRLMRLSGKPKLLKKTPVGAASSRELKRSRLEAAPTISNTLVLSR